MADSSQPSQSLPCEDVHLIFLPGLHGTDELYDDLLAQIDQRSLETNFHTTLINYPPDLKQNYEELFKWLCSFLQMDQKKTDTKTIIIAESFSTPLALKLANNFPQQIKGLVIGGGFCASPVNPALALLPLRPLLMIAPPLSAVRHFLTGSESSAELTAKVHSVVKKVSSKNLTQRVRSILTLEEDQAPSIPKTPLLILQAEDDTLIPWEIQNQLENHLPHAEVHWLKSPHLIFQVHPKTSASHIAKFLHQI